MLLLHFLVHFIISSTIGSYIPVDGPELCTIMNPGGVELMKTPSKNSNALHRLEFGDLVWSDWFIGNEFKEHNYVKDTLDGVEGFWIEVFLDDSYNHNTSNSKPDGYVFSPYLYVGNLLMETDSEYVLEYEGIQYGKTKYNPNLNWYGFYQKGDQFLIKKVDLKLILSTIDSSVRDSGIYNSNQRDDRFTRFISLTTEDTLVAEYFIGSNSKVKTGDVKTLFSNFEVGIFGNNGTNFLHPNQVREYDFNQMKYFLEASEYTVQKDELNSNKNYKLKIRIENNENVITDTQLGLYGSVKEHSGYKSPTLNWVGDLNMDGILDFEFKTNSMEDKCGGFVRRNIYLSKKDKKIEYSGPLIIQENNVF